MDRDAVFGALADANRRLILDRLMARNGQSLVELCAGMDMSRQAVSKHIAVLEAAELVLSIRQGRTRRHYLNPVPIHAEAMRWLKRFDNARLINLADIEAARTAAS
ncbi:MAG TPA: metalloregulator ArsR/SmtB family transcription factor [Devosiaceae bacterium]